MRVLFGIALLLVIGVVQAHDHVCDCSFTEDTDDWPVECDGLATSTPDGVEKFVRTILCDPSKIVKWTSSLKREVVDEEAEEEVHEVEARSHCARSAGVCSGPDGAKAYNPARYQCSHEEKRCYEVPPAWRCEPNWFNQATHTPNKPEPAYSEYGNGTKNACHCGCGFPDPDCGTELAAKAIFCNAPAFSAVGGNSPVEGDPKTQYCHNPTGTCKTVPEGWTCAAYLYNEYESHAINGIRTKYTCDCNCGVWDPDCNVATRTSCWLNDEDEDDDVTTDVTDTIQTPESHIDLLCDEDSDCIVPSESESSESSESVSESEGESPTPVLHSSTRLCSAVENTCYNIPAGWLCPARWYNETGTQSYGPNGIPDCNCGCGIPDPDCDYQHLRTTQGPHFFGLYANAEGDTPVGAYRPVTNPKDACNTLTGLVYRVPNGWSCLPTDYNEVETGMYGVNGKADCNCGCGDVWDPDCDHQDEETVGLVCHGVRGESKNSREFCAANTNTCELAPQKWVEKCPAVYYGETLSGTTGTRGKPFCDCYCGETVDPDCLHQNLRFENSSALGLACNDSGVDDTNALHYCSFEFDTALCDAAPETWTCSPDYYNEVKTGLHTRGKPICDCDCGAWDEDCYTDTRADQGFASYGLICDSDTGVESSDIREYCSKKNVDQNANNNAGLPVCSRAPDSWFCAGVYWNEFDSESYDPSSGTTCDCGCGLYDYDCNSTIISSSRNFLRCGGGGSRMLNVLGNYIDCSASCPFCELSNDSKQPK